MLGMSKYQTRSDLLKEKAIGKDLPRVPDLQLLFDNGHRFEAMARPWAEEAIGGKLSPIVASAEIDGLPLSASYDGAGSNGIIWEHKTLNQELAASLDQWTIPEQYKPQMEQQLLILGATRCLFMASNGDRESMRSAWYESDPALRAKLLAAWRQFAEDVKNYSHVEVLPPATGKAIMALPPLTVQLVGEVKASNLVLYRATALAFIQSINTDLKTDEDFATAEKVVKFCGDAESELEAVKKRALGQTASIDELFRTVDVLREEMRGKRLELEKLVKIRKESIREEIRREGIKAYGDHLAALNVRLGKPYLPPLPVDFALVMKGKKTITSLRDAVNTECARAKIEASAIADKIQANLTTMRELATEHSFLFHDTAQLLLKDHDDLTALVKIRIADHKFAEERRLEGERARIRAEELAKIEAERISAEKKEAERIAAADSPHVPPVIYDPKRGLIDSRTGESAPAPVATAALPKPAVTLVKGSIRPTDDAIIKVLALNYRVADATVIQWLLAMDLRGMTEATA